MREDDLDRAIRAAIKALKNAIAQVENEETKAMLQARVDKLENPKGEDA